MLFLFTHYYSYQFILNTMMGYTFITLSRSTRFLYPTICSRLICYGLFFSAFVYFARSPTSLLMFWVIFFRIHIFCPFFHVSSSFIFKMGEFLHLTSKQPSFFLLCKHCFTIYATFFLFWISFFLNLYRFSLFSFCMLCTCICIFI